MRERLELLAGARSGWEHFAEETLELVGRGLGFDAAVIAPMDPETGLISGSVKRDLPDDSYPAFARYEYVTPAPGNFAELGRRSDPVAVLREETAGDPRRNARFDEFLAPQLGIAHEVRVAGTADGRLVGGLSLFRSSSAQGFDEDSAGLLRAIAPLLARGLRTAPARTAVSSPVRDHAVVLVDGDGRLEASSEGARAWIAQLDPTGTRPVPVPIVTVVTAARLHGSGELRVASASGWVRVRGTAVHRAGGAPTTVVDIEPMRGLDAAQLTVSTIGLTRREREVVELVLGGASTAEIARRLQLSGYTVQDHLKAVFAKTGVRSRRELVASLLG